MKTADFADMALGASGLQRIMIVGLPECLPLKQWSRTEALDEDSAARQLGGAFRAAQAALRMVAPSAGTGSLSIETETALVVIAPLAPNAAAAFVFDRGAPLGLVRVQVAQLSTHLASMVPELAIPTSLPTSVPLPAAATLFNGQSAPATVAPDRATNTEDGSRGVRLLELFRRCAQDPYASMVRLSLRTGLSFEELSKPESLNETKVETLGLAIREILGRDDLGL